MDTTFDSDDDDFDGDDDGFDDDFDSDDDGFSDDYEELMGSDPQDPTDLPFYPPEVNIEVAQGLWPASHEAQYQWPLWHRCFHEAHCPSP